MNYVTYHLHTDLSLLDSCTQYEEYIKKATELGQKAIAFTEHSNIYEWVEKKIACDEAGIKYIHGIEIYLTEQLEPKVRDNYHTILLAKNYEGVKEINSLASIATREDHSYYKPRISFEEFFNISSNVIKISACLASPLNNRFSNSIYKKLCMAYDYYEVQPHVNSIEQKYYNEYLYLMSQKYGKPLIAGTDTHSLNSYKSECRKILKKAKKMMYDSEDDFDLTYKSYNELVEAFAQQGVLPEDVYLEAIKNTVRIADTVEDFKLDKSFKYPIVSKDEEKDLMETINKDYQNKVKRGIIDKNQNWIPQIKEEFRVLKKIGMIGFILFFSRLIKWCWKNNIPVGPGRGSVTGSAIAYITDITDVNPFKWKTIFSRFANETRIEIGDIDMDFDPAQRKLVYDHIMDEFGYEYTAFILAIGTIDDKGVIDEIARALEIDSEPIKNDYALDPEKAKARYPEVFYYFDGLKGCAVSQSMHPAGIVVSPITLMDNYGYFFNEDGDRVMYINMEEIHEVSLVKYDILGLKQIAVLRNICETINQKYPQSHEVDWNDEAVWDNISTSPIGIFQFESDYSFKLLQRYKPRSIYDLTMLTAALRPAGESYREQWIQRIPNQNPSKQIDEILADNNGYLIFQEDVLKFLQEVCGLPGSEADNVRRAIGRKQLDRLQAAMPTILEGYCSKSDKSREEAETEAMSFLKIIEDASSYMFNYNHAIAYSMISYLCAYYRYYYPMEFICAYLNNAQNDDDITGGTALAESKGIKILPPTFGGSGALYTCDYKKNSIYKGVASIKSLNVSAAENLKAISDAEYSSFTDLLYTVKETKSCNMGQLKVLIKINYFRAFGGNQKLLYVCEVFEELYDKKTVKKGKESDLGVTAEFLAENCEKVTTAQYNNCNMKKIILNTEENIPNTSIGIIDQLEAELKYLGYIQSRYNVALDYYYVLDINTKYSPILYLHNLAEGSTLKIKTRKNKVFNIKTGEQYTYAGDIISIVSIASENKRRLIDGEWQELDEKEDILKSYALVKKGNRCLPEKKRKN